MSIQITADGLSAKGRKPLGPYSSGGSAGERAVSGFARP
jgi:hypothetical protein